MGGNKYILASEQMNMTSEGLEICLSVHFREDSKI